MVLVRIKLFSPLFAKWPSLSNGVPTYCRMSPSQRKRLRVHHKACLNTSWSGCTQLLILQNEHRDILYVSPTPLVQPVVLSTVAPRRAQPLTSWQCYVIHSGFSALCWKRRRVWHYFPLLLQSLSRLWDSSISPWCACQDRFASWYGAASRAYSLSCWPWATSSCSWVSLDIYFKSGIFMW